MHAPKQTGAYVAGLCAVLAWSTVATAFKISLAHLTPAQLLLWANLASLAALLSVLSIQGRLREVRIALGMHWRRSLLLGAINPFAYYLVLFQAYALLPAQEAQAINYTWALTLSLLSVPVLKQRLRARDVLSALVCYCGVLAIATHGQPFSLHFGNPRGVTLALCSTLLWAGYWLANTRDMREPVLGLTLNFLFSLPLVVLWCAWRGELMLPSWQGLAGATYVGAFEMGFTFVLWLVALKRAHSTARIANLIFLSPLISLLLIHWLLGEAILPSTLAGLGLILAGLILQKIPQRQAAML
jgi:drug/metabolite transporter (DMT)-like permease